MLFDGTLELALQTLDQQIRLHIAANATDWILVQAGVVAVSLDARPVPGVVQRQSGYRSDLCDRNRVSPLQGRR